MNEKDRSDFSGRSFWLFLRWAQLGEAFECLHGFVEPHAHDLHEQVDGVASVSGGGTDPIGLFDEDLFGQVVDSDVSVLKSLHGVFHLFEQGLECDAPGGANALCGPFIAR